MMLRVAFLLMVVMMGIAMSQEQAKGRSLLQKTLRGARRNQGARSFCSAACPRIYLPVCGSDGKTYPSPCVLNYYSCAYANVTYAYQGSCEVKQRCPTWCPRVKAPVCGSDGRTYSNTCRLRLVACAGTGITKVKDAACSASGGRSNRPCPVACPYNYAPVCGSNGVAYPNPCTLEAAACKDSTITLAYQGACEEQSDQGVASCPKVCTFEYAPVCGSDGATYANPCILRVAACTANPSLRVAYQGACGVAGQPRPPCPPSCRGTYDPVCGSDGQTYGNQCTLELVSCRDSSVTLARRGVCGVAFSTCPDVCPEVEEPVCGSDGVTYTNECVFRSSTCRDTTGSVTTTAGECAATTERPCPVLCPARYEPVCGTDGKTYPNQCVLESEACFDPTLAMANTGQCLNNSDQPPSKTPTRPVTPRPPIRSFNPRPPTTTRPPITFTLMPPRLFCPNNCVRVFNPVCGSDGRTYYNRCLMGLVGCRERWVRLSVAYSGLCAYRRLQQQ